MNELTSLLPHYKPSPRKRRWTMIILSLVILIVIIFFIVFFTLSKSHDSQTKTPFFSLYFYDDDSRFSVLVSGDEWFDSSNVKLFFNNQWFSAFDGSLIFTLVNSGGSDDLGDFELYSFSWKVVGISDPVMVTSFRRYLNHFTILFSQAFPQELQNTATGNVNGLSSVFPVFTIKDQVDLGVLTWHGNMAGHHILSKWKLIASFPHGLEGGPIAFFNEDMSSSVVISPASNFMAASHFFDHSDKSLSFGIMGNVTHIPAEYSIEFVMVGSNNGINHCMSTWGNTLKHLHNYDRLTPELSVSHLGYYTDNGAYYYYETETDRNYEETMIDVKAYLDSISAPFRYMQFDSWWYHRGKDQGVSNWTARSDIFPHGLHYVWQKLNLPIVAHSKMWSSENIYAKQNGGKYDFIVESKYAIPIVESFWMDLFLAAKQWGLITYEQDWMYNEFSGLSSCTNSPTLGRQWLLQMGQAASDTDIRIQYCMPFPRMILQSIEIPSVSHIRVSNDYCPGNSQWKIGITSMLAGSLGLAPFKDTFWTTSVQSGNRYKSSEDSPQLQSLIATISTGPVAPSDKIGHVNVTLLNKSAMLDGLILKPERPATPLNSFFLARTFGNGPKGEIYSTFYHPRNAPFRWFLISSVFQPNYFSLSLEDLIKSNSVVSFPSPNTEITSFLAYEHRNPHSFFSVSYDSPLIIPPSNKTDFSLYHFSPVFPNGLSFLGEIDKWVPVSSVRFFDFTLFPSGFRIGALVTEHEDIKLSVFDMNDIQSITCPHSTSGFVYLFVQKTKPFTMKCQ